MMARRFTVTPVLVITALMLAAGCAGPAPDHLSRVPEMNLVLISLDTLRGDRLGMYGCPDPVSPFMDRWVAGGVVFPDVLAQVPSTVASHRAMFTSRYLFQQTAGEPCRTMASRFGAAGFETAAFVDGGLMHRRFGNAEGFGLYDDRGGGLTAVASRAEEWIGNHREQRFMVFMHTYDIHCPYDPPAPFDRLFSPDIPVRFEVSGTCGGTYFNRMDMSPADYAVLNRFYNGGIRHVDGRLEVFWRRLTELGLAENTLLVVVSDHGESLGERRFVGHNQLYDTHLKVPWFMIIPGSPETLVPGSWEIVDILPTLLDLFGMEKDNGMSGSSWRDGTAVGRGGAPGALRPTAVRTAVRRYRLAETADKTVYGPGGWKLILRGSPDRDELYRPEDDPEERQNRADQFPDTADRLRTAIQTLTGTPVPDSRSPSRHFLLNDPHSMDVPGLPTDGGEDLSSDLKDQLAELGYLLQ